MAQNKLSDLNNHLFAQLERLGDEEMTLEELKKEAERAKAIALISKNVIDNAKLVLEAVKFSNMELPLNRELPAMFESNQII